AAAICRRLDGIPLAIELAAARSEALGIDAVADRLDDRFTLLAGGRRPALPRHQTLRPAFHSRPDLLPAGGQQGPRRLSVFAGPVAGEMAADVVGEGPRRSGWIATHLASLVAKSLVVAEHGARPAGSPHYHLLETVRAYAAEKLAEAGETEGLARRHA